MRLIVALRVSVPARRGRERDEAPVDDIYSFWRAFAEEVVPQDDLEKISDFERFAHDQEARVRTNLARSLENSLSQHISTTTIIVKSISYGSLNIGLEVITGSLAAIGFTPDDVIRLLERYAPQAVIDTAPGWRKTSATLGASASGTVAENTVEAEPPPPPRPQSRFEKSWWIANTSLVVPALILLAGAFLVFQASEDEHARSAAAMTQERSDIAAERQKILDRYDSQMKAVEDNFASQLKHSGELYDLEIQLLKTREDQIKGQSSK